MATLICCTLLDQFRTVVVGILRTEQSEACTREATMVCLSVSEDEQKGETIRTFVRAGPTDQWSIDRLTCSYYPRKLSFIYSHVPLFAGCPRCHSTEGKVSTTMKKWYDFPFYLSSNSVRNRMILIFRKQIKSLFSTVLTANETLSLSCFSPSYLFL